MTKSEFVDKVASTSGLSKKDADNAVNAVISTIEQSLKSGEDVNFTGFGKFHVADRGAREGRNPRAGESMTIAASRVPLSTAGPGPKKTLKSHPPCRAPPITHRRPVSASASPPRSPPASRRS